jgi:hypothetical protein
MRFASFCLGLVLCLATASCRQANNTPNPYEPNGNIASFKDFYLAAASTDLSTYVRGTVFIYGQTDKSTKAIITVWVVVDPQDFGGIIIDLPNGWSVTSLVSSYPENYIHLWEGAAAKPNKELQIGSDVGPVLTGVGQGNVVLTLEPNQNTTALTGQFEVYIAAGSKTLDNGMKVEGTDSTTIDVPLG